VETGRVVKPDVPQSRGHRRGARESKLKGEPNKALRFLRLLGPGFIVGASDDDPSGIATYAAAGAAFGFATLWTTLVTIPMMTTVQFICAKIGQVSGRGLAGVIRKHYPRWVLYPVVFGLLIANTINAGADIGAIAAGVNIFVPIKAVALIVPVGATLLVLQILLSYRTIANTFKWLALALFAYIGSSLLSHPHAVDMLRGTFVPAFRWNSDYLAILVALLGTTISPYMFFWQSSQEVEEDIEAGRRWIWQRKGTTKAELRYTAWDVGIGMFFSNVVAYFIIAATAATLFQAGHHDVLSAADAARALEPLAGKAAGLLFALGIIGAGVLAVPILTGSASYAIAESFGWKWGLDEKPQNAIRFYGIIALSTVAGLEINFLGINPFKALVWTAVINGLLAPPLLALIMLIGNNKKVMGTLTNGPLTNVVGWITTAAMSAAAVGLIATWSH